MPKPRRIVIDVETGSGADLKKLGAYKYFEHPWATLEFVSWSEDGEPARSWVPASGAPMPPALASIKAGDTIVAHRSSFERTALRSHAGKRAGFNVDGVLWDCTRARSTAYGLPPSLNEASKAMGFGEKLDLPPKFFAPYTQAPTRDYLLNRADTLKDYCPRDVDLSVKLDAALPRLDERDTKLIDIDARINDRGWLLDKEAARLFATGALRAKPLLIADCERKHGIRPTSPKQLLPKLLEYGVDTPDARADTLRILLKSDTLPDVARELIEFRLEAAQNAGSKYHTALLACMADGRLRGMFQFYSALNGRWGSYVVQLQNMKRSLSKETGKEYTDAEVAAILDGLLAGATIGYGEVSGLVRHMFVAPDGKSLLSIDLKQIEARVLSWLANAHDRLAVFRDPLADIYTETGRAIGGTRFDGKIAELYFGYQGGWRAVVRGARKFGASVSESSARQRVYAWRNANMNRPIVKLWDALERAALETVRKEMVTRREGRLTFGMCGDALRVTCPSGGHIYYHRPRIDTDGRLIFFGMNTHTRQFEEDASLYGGRLAQNATSRTGRDTIGDAMIRIDAAAPEFMTGTVHDEVVGEGDARDAPDLEQLVIARSDWMDGILPIAADTSVRHRYA